MTTARDVIAKAICWGTEGASKCFCNDKTDCAYGIDADAVIAALLAAPESVRLELAGLLNPWRPIETAPKDGTDMLLYSFNSQVDCGWYQDGWIRIDACDDPTHWLPLPAPPSEDKP